MEQEKKASRRLSLTNKQLEESAAVELLSLLKTVGEDGKLTDTEIEELRAWVTDHADSELPAVDYLRQVSTKVLADGIVTDEERKELQQAIERVLPLEDRKLIAGKRRSAEGEKRAEERAAKVRNRPVSFYDFMVAGAKRSEYARYAEDVSEGDTVYLLRQPGNEYDRNAIQVLTPSRNQCGWVPREDAKELAKELDSGCKYVACVKKILGYEHAIPVVMVEVFSKDATNEEARGPEFTSTITKRSEPGCGLTLVTFIAVPIILLLWQ